MSLSRPLVAPTSTLAFVAPSCRRLTPLARRFFPRPARTSCRKSSHFQGWDWPHTLTPTPPAGGRPSSQSGPPCTRRIRRDRRLHLRYWPRWAATGPRPRPRARRRGARRRWRPSRCRCSISWTTTTRQRPAQDTAGRTHSSLMHRPPTDRGSRRYPAPPSRSALTAATTRPTPSRGTSAPAPPARRSSLARCSCRSTRAPGRSQHQWTWVVRCSLAKCPTRRPTPAHLSPPTSPRPWRHPSTRASSHWLRTRCLNGRGAM
mmetsp:Transcript_31040/g.90186  ORF Transcript_31040/g.90186 Transcript_31040/m.90186 type:complete len:261 (-) Transcript_31040:97-879(-)